VDEDTAWTQLGELVYDDPQVAQLVPAPQYLSGNLRDKLDAARTAAITDPRFAVNVAALQRTLPRDLGPGEIEARMGASWIAPTYVQQFLAEILEDPTITVSRVAGSAWEVESKRRNSVLAITRWGTKWCPAPEIAQHLLEQRPIRLTEENADGKRVFSAARTIASQEKATEMGERFADWVWEDAQRCAELVAHYNRVFNSLVLRTYDQTELSLPGLALSFEPRPHQLAAVARVIAEPSVGLWHEVGAGKTAEMAIAAMELRRLGLAGKPAIVVPNHMLQQFTCEFLELYPRAKLLAASTEDLTAEKRRRFVGKVTTGDWDAVIITRGAFERIPMSPHAQEQYLTREMDMLDLSLARATEAADRLAVKRLEKMRMRAEERIKASMAAAKDPGVTFELTGIDYLFVDEAHGFKNLRTPSNMPNMQVDGSNRATDLHMKIEYLRGRSPRVVTFATATPIANSMGEAYTMLRFLRPDLLDAMGITDFDVFAATFGETVSQIEVAPEGGVRFNTRFAKFINVPELLRPWHIAGDVKTADDLKLNVPALAPRPGDGQRLAETVVVASSFELSQFISLLADRAAAVRARAVHPSDDNMLSITHEGRSAALDLRLVGRATDEVSKIDIAAQKIAEIWRDNRDTIYLDRDDEPHPRPGGLQIVFADLGTPNRTGARTARGRIVTEDEARPGLRVTDNNADRAGTITDEQQLDDDDGEVIAGVHSVLWDGDPTPDVVATGLVLRHEQPEPGSGRAGFDVYDALRGKLVAQGMPRDQIRFIHEARNDREKQDLFDACRDGRVSVLIGSTEKMGTGTNVQTRAIALHHLDCPWRPADLQQREGRIVRQGNQNAEVRILRFVTEGSFDSYSWQTVTRKAAFIAQIMRGTLEVREIEDIGDSALSYNEVKALAAGNPLLLDHAEAQAELTRLERLQTNHHLGREVLRLTIGTANSTITAMRTRAGAADSAITKRVDVRGDNFAITLATHTYTARPDAIAALRDTLTTFMTDPGIERGTSRILGTFGGFDVQATLYRDINRHPSVQLELLGVPLSAMTMTPTEVAQQDLLGRLANRLSDLETVKAKALADIDSASHDIDVAQAQLDAPFRYAQPLTEARQRFAELDAQLRAQASPPPPVSTDPGTSSDDNADEPDQYTSMRLRHIPIDDTLDLNEWLTQHAAHWSTPPVDADRQWLARTAAAIAGWPDVQAAAMAGNATGFITTFDQHLRSVIDGALAVGTRPREGFWDTCLSEPDKRRQLAAARAAAYNTIRGTARQVGLTPQPTKGDDRGQLPPDPQTPVVLTHGGRNAATALQEWITDHTTDLPAQPSIEEQEWLTHVTASLTQVEFLQSQALNQDLIAFTPTFAAQFRNAFTALLGEEPTLAQEAAILRAVTQPDGLNHLIDAAARAAFMSIRRETARHDTTGRTVPEDLPPRSAARTAFTAPDSESDLPALPARPAPLPALPAARPHR
jgi:hypothetical protein